MDKSKKIVFDLGELELTKLNSLGFAFAEKPLQAYCTLFSMLFDAAEDKVAILDHLGLVVYVNPAILNAREVLLSDVQGKTGLELFPEDVVVRHYSYAVQQVIASAKPKSLLLNKAHTSEPPVYETANITPIINSQQRVVGTVTICRRNDQDKRLEYDEIKRREHYQRALLDSFPFMVWLKDKDHRFLATNAVFAQVAGVTNTHELEGKTDFDFFPEELAKQYIEGDEEVLKSGTSADYVELIRKSNGNSYWAETYKSPVTINGEVIGTVGFARDLTENQKLRSDISRKELEYIALVKSLPLTIVRYDLDCKRIFINTGNRGSQESAIPALLGKTPKELWSSSIKNITGERFQERLLEVMRSGTSQTFELYCEHEGRNYVNMLTLEPEFNEFNAVIGALTIASDITEMSQYRQRLEHLAFHDPLTNLPNRTLLNERMQFAVHHATRYQNLFGLLFLDLDYFKSINDTLGHAVGDQLLIEAGNRLSSCVRNSDVLARIGGDEFAVLAMDINHHHDLAGLASKIAICFAEPFDIEGNTFFITVSTGIACYPSDSENIEGLMKYADTAMYHAKKKGRNNIQFYSAALTSSVAERLDIETALRFAIANNEFSLHYQSIVDMKLGKILGAEALLRWNNNALGEIAPDKFIPIAEECGLIVEIGAWVLRQACHAAVALNKGRDVPLKIAVNLSSRQFVRHNIYATLVDCLQTTGCHPSWITLEITESLLLQDSDDVLKMLTKLTRMGVTLAIDDFGTGYSALAYLNKFPITQVKIDRSFVNDISTNKNAALLVKAIIAMTQSLNKDLIAEGIETIEQASLLNSFGCHQGQGFLFSQAIPLQQFSELLQQDSSILIK